ncbi:MAG TPA: DNA primase [Planctomycetes bacterium]|nr:DNA primase [Planctomycetota bacterium]
MAFLVVVSYQEMSVSFDHSNDAREQIRQAIDIVDLVGGSLTLRRQGRLYVGLCPWHEDARPSLQVNPDRQSWKCWVCNLGGDIFSFTMQREGIDFRQALELLADQAGISLARNAGKRDYQPGDPRDKRNLYQAMAWVEQQYHQYLLKAAEAAGARDYLAQRDITAESIARHHLGYAPDQWQWLLDQAKSTPHSPALLEGIGAVAKSESGRVYDRFKGRIIFPIRDSQARPIAFGGRILPANETERSAKYINSPETRLFSKSDQLYALDLARQAASKANSLMVMEGYTDVIMAHQHGIANAVAVLGTALGPRHVQLLKRFADKIILILDGDDAGQRRTNEILELFIAAEVDLRILTLPDGMDPCDFLQTKGQKLFLENASTAVDALEHKVQSVLQGIDTVNDTHQSHQALEEILGTLAQAPGSQSSRNESRRLLEQQILSRLARQFAVAEEVLRTRLIEIRSQQQSSRPAGPREPIKHPGADKTWQPLDPKEVELLEILILDPDLVLSALEHIKISALPTETGRSLYTLYTRLAADGHHPEFGYVLTQMEDPQLKSILVETDETANAKAEHVQTEAAERLDELVNGFQREALRTAGRQQLAALENNDLNLEEEKELLQKVIDQERRRQSMSAPTDG